MLTVIGWFLDRRRKRKRRLQWRRVAREPVFEEPCAEMVAAGDEIGAHPGELVDGRDRS